MTTQEMFERLIELLAIGVVRAVKDKTTDSSEATTSGLISAKCGELIPIKIGRIPFGQSKGEQGRETNPTGIYWINKIQQLSTKGYSSEQIARLLNQEDLISQRAGRWSRTTVWRIQKRIKQKDVTK